MASALARCSAPARSSVSFHVHPESKVSSIGRKRSAQRRWLSEADLKAIRDLYAQAKYLTAKTGKLHVVDHIVPKIGGTVCGLHVPWNLRVIHWLDNAQKGAAWWPDMWMVQLELL